jgi:hypothetical protein
VPLQCVVARVAASVFHIRIRLRIICVFAYVSNVCYEYSHTDTYNASICMRRISNSVNPCPELTVYSPFLEHPCYNKFR